MYGNYFNEESNNSFQEKNAKSKRKLSDDTNQISKKPKNLNTVNSAAENLLSLTKSETKKLQTKGISCKLICIIIYVS